MADPRTRTLPRGTTVKYPGDPGYIGSDPAYFDGDPSNGEIVTDPRTGETRVNQPDNWISKYMPYAVVAGMAAPHVAGLFGAGGAAGSGVSAGVGTANVPSGLTMPPGVNSTPWWQRLLGMGGNAASGGGNGILDRVLGQILPLGLAGGATIMGLKNNTPPAESQLKGIIDLAQRRSEGAEPLYQALNAMAMDDAGLAQRRRASAEPLFNSMATMAKAQMPRYTREG